MDALNNATIDDGNGKIDMWRIENFEKVLVDESNIGEFYDGDSFIILYTYVVPPSETKQYIIYFWQGRYSTMDEEGASAILSAQLDEQLGGSPTQVRVTQGKEPNHFCALFKGLMIIHSGGVASGFKNVKAHDDIDTDGCRLYHVKGSQKENTYSIAVKEEASSLNSTACFVLIYFQTTYLWKGGHCEEFEYEAAMKIAEKLGEGEVQIVEEENEPDEFWEALGGKMEYAHLRAEEEMPSEPRLFLCTDAFGEFSMSEISSFTQEDLNIDDVMILDVGTSVYVWIGSGANKDENSKAYESAKKYIEASPDDRNVDIPIISIIAGSEPIIFTQWFDNWDPELATKNAFVDPYETKLKENAEKEAAEEAAEEETVEASTTESQEQVSNENEKVMDVAHREDALSDEEFLKVFEMSREEFKALKKWRQIQKKKEVGLF